MNLLQQLRTKAMIDRPPWDDFFVGPYGNLYPLLQQTLVGGHETIAPEFESFVRNAFKECPIIFTCIANRLYLLSEGRFQWRARINGRPGNVFGNAELGLLEKPWPGGTTGNLIALAELHSSLAGNFFTARRPGRQLRIMRPDWTAIILGSENDPDVDGWDLDAQVIGYEFTPGGAASGRDPEFLLPEEVAHFMPIPDPQHPWRGVSWLSPVIDELLADKAQTVHKKKFLNNGATPNMIVTLQESRIEKFLEWVTKFKGEHEGIENRYKTVFLGAGADAKVVGSNLQQLDFSKTQGAGEVRIAATAMVPAPIAGISEGLQGSSLNAGNLETAWRQFANGWARPTWRGLAASLEQILDVPDAAELWVDDRDIPALQEDTKKLAEVDQVKAAAASTLISAGYEPESVVAALEAHDFTRLKHTGMTSVQLHPPGEGGDASVNGAQPAEAPVPA